MAPELSWRRSYLGIERSGDPSKIQITANNTRTIDQQKALYKAIADRLATAVGIGRKDMLISLVEVGDEDSPFKAVSHTMRET